MNKFVSILTASVAGLMAVGTANAADLPSKKAAPAEYVKICDAFGAGFFYIPGSDTCLKIGGYVRAEYRLRSHPLITDNEIFFRSRGDVSLDARTKTAYGDLRTLIEMRITDDSGSGSVPFLTNAFVNFAGITAGRVANSPFDFYAHDYEWIGLTTSSDITTNILAYTAKFGSGFSATVSLEDPSARDSSGLPGTSPLATASNSGYGVNGTRVPDVVGVLKVDQAWGSAQLSGALHEINANLPIPAVDVTKTGYAIQASVKANLPMLAAGDTAILQGAYTNGATDYINSADIGSVFATGKHLTVLSQSAVAINGGSSLGLVKSWTVFAGMDHYWAPTFHQTVFGSYQNMKMPDNALGSLKAWNEDVFVIGTSLIWVPVKSLKMGPEITYENVKYKQATGGPALPTLSKGNDVRFAMRLQRNF